MKVSFCIPIALYPYVCLISIPDVQAAFGGTVIEEKVGKDGFVEFVLRLQAETGEFGRDHNIIYNSPYLPHPFFPNPIQDNWLKMKYIDGYWEHGKINIPMIASSVSLIVLKKLEGDKIAYDLKWANAIEAFTKLRLSCLGLKSDILDKPIVDDTKKIDEGDPEKTE